MTFAFVPEPLRAGDAQGQEQRAFDLPAGEAASTLRLFSSQAGVQLLVSSDDIRGIKTREVHGELKPLAAIQKMLENTQLVAREDRATGTIAVVAAASAHDEGSAPPKPNKPKKTSQMKSSRIARLAAALAASATSYTLHAQSAGSDQGAVAGDTIVLPQFSITAASNGDRYHSTDAVSAVRISGSILDTPQSVAVLTRDFISDINPVRLYDATRYVAGITEGRGVGFSDRIVVRGYESDGRIVDNFSFNSAANFEEALVERVEVLKGPNTILSPSGTPGGSVNVIMKSPQFERANLVTATLGLFDAQKLTVDSTGAIGSSNRFAYRVIGVYQDSDRFWTDSKLKTKLIAPELTFKPSERSDITFKYVYGDYETWGDPRVLVDSAVVDGADAEKAAGFARDGLNGAEGWNYRRAKYNLAELNFTTALSDAINMRLAAQFWADYEPSELASLALPGTTNRYNPYTGQLTPDYIWSAPSGSTNYTSTYSPYYNPASIPRTSSLGKAWNETFQVQNDFAAKHKIGGVSLTTVAGWFFVHSQNKNQQRNGTLPNISIFDPVYGSRPVYSANLASLSTSQTRSEQVYALEKAGFWNDRITVTGGASRFWTYSRSTNVLANTPTSVLKDKHDTYLAGLVIKPIERASIYYSFSTNAAPTLANNVPLWREGRQHEYGVKAEFLHRKLSVTLAHFQIAQTNVSIPNPEYQLDRTKPQQIISSFKNHGVELEINGAVTKNLSVIVTASDMKTRDSLGRKPRAVADRSAGLFLNYHFTDGTLNRLGLYAGVSYTGEAAGDAPPSFTPLGVVAQPSFMVPAYTTVTAGASYTWDRYSLRLTADNILDNDYYYSSGARFAVAESSTPNVRLSVGVKF
ncbi:MAG TPA: TonB-dependent receptor plug domain-containing protein [Opitutaceae bacterium]|nr:TonB-dependent receptor plug domain-containing protein [Opitutaceae bacterium]